MILTGAVLIDFQAATEQKDYIVCVSNEPLIDTHCRELPVSQEVLPDTHTHIHTLIQQEVPLWSGIHS